MTGRADLSLIVAFGTDTGNAEDAAMTAAEALAGIGIAVEAIELNQVDISDLKKNTTHLIAVISTFGDGEFPDSATVFWEALCTQTERFEQLHFCILALGDSSYELFCNAGVLLEQRLTELGAEPMMDRVDVDGFYAEPAQEWTGQLIELLTAERTQPTAQDLVTVHAPKSSPTREQNSPVVARLTANRRLNASESDKEVHHYELDLTGTGLSYRCGDSLAVHAPNDPALVDTLLSRFGVDPDYVVSGHSAPLGSLLREHFEIRSPPKALLHLAASRINDGEMAELLRAGDTHAESDSSWLYGRDVLDIVDLADLKVDEVVDTLRPLQFRDYSIASSPLAHPDHVHLTVASVRYDIDGRRHHGVASTYLADRCEEVLVHLRPNNHFRLPPGDVPIIMIGPGTGIAPFRAFLQERRATGATGKAWLFFGDRRRSLDFLYGDELADFAEAGVLTNLHLAFSRDQDDKVYVQHRIAENADEFFAWVQDGAYVYVCGDAHRMAKDVDAALHEVIVRAGGLNAEDAHVYVNNLIRSHRYVREVY